MSIRALYKRYSILFIILCGGVLIGGLLAVVVTSSVTPAAAEAPEIYQDTMQIPENVNAIWYQCNPVSVAAYTTRVHVQCDVPVSGISYFAAPATNPKHAARSLSLLLTAQATGNSVSVLYDPSDTSGSSFGCGVDDCRTMIGVAIP